MQASELWSGHEYAHVDGRPKGVETPMYASRVRVLKVYKEKSDSWSERKTTFAQVEFLDKDDNVTRQASVRARDIVDFWDEYKDRYDHIMAERKKRDEERAAHMQRQEIQKERIENYFANKFDVRPYSVRVYPSTVEITFNKEDLENVPELQLGED